MLTEPVTTPPTKILRIAYGTIIGLLYGSGARIGTLYMSPELSLLIGNIFTLIVSPKEKLILRLKEEIKIAPDIYEYAFTPNQRPNFSPGQYMEWTLPHHGIDSRGNRRYFTLASSPTEDTIRVGVKFVNSGSSFKKSMMSLESGDVLVASQLAGNFTLPKDKNIKLAFLAGGIGVTPFRSMVKFLVDAREKRNITLVYINKTAEEIVYRDIFETAEKEIGLKTICSLTEVDKIPSDWKGVKGRVTKETITSAIPDYMERYFFLSGPRSMVLTFEDTLEDLGVPKSQIITDYFPGYA